MFTYVPWPDKVRSQESKYLGGGSLQIPEYLAYLLTKTLSLSRLYNLHCLYATSLGAAARSNTHHSLDQKKRSHSEKSVPSPTVIY